MTGEIEKFENTAQSIALSNRCKEFAVSMAAVEGGDPASALFGAAIKVIEERFGKEHILPVAKIMLESVVEAERGPGAH